MLASLRVLRAWLASEQVTVVAMEATGVYWKPVWYELEDAGVFELKLFNPHHVKAVSGRKTDVRDAEWLAKLVECDLVEGSFVPPRPLRELRDVTRYRRRVVEESVREQQRLQKLLEDAQVKLDSVVSDITGVSARLIFEALCAGERDPEVLADLAKAKLRGKIPQLREAVPGRFSDHHALLVREHLAHLDYLAAMEARLDARVDELIDPFSTARDLSMTIPGVAKRTAENVIAEIGVDMEAFPTPDHLASWAGMCPGNNESAGKRRSGKSRKGDPWLQAALVEAAWAAVRTNRTSMQARFRRLTKRRGPEQAPSTPSATNSWSSSGGSSTSRTPTTSSATTTSNAASTQNDASGSSSTNSKSSDTPSPSNTPRNRQPTTQSTPLLLRALTSENAAQELHETHWFGSKRSMRR